MRMIDHMLKKVVTRKEIEDRGLGGRHFTKPNSCVDASEVAMLKVNRTLMLEVIQTIDSQNTVSKAFTALK